MCYVRKNVIKGTRKGQSVALLRRSDGKEMRGLFVCESVEGVVGSDGGTAVRGKSRRTWKLPPDPIERYTGRSRRRILKEERSVFQNKTDKGTAQYFVVN